MTPEQIVTEQHALYNARDLDAYVRLWTDDAKIIDHNAQTIVADGIDAIRAHYENRFTQSPDLFCKVINRMCLGDWVVDHEIVKGIGDVPLEVIAVYEVKHGLIASLGFLFK